MEAQVALSASGLRQAMNAYHDVLVAHKEEINRLNVYPVPDGDTGTNMALTVESVVHELEGLGEGASMSEVCRAVSHGSLMGARGNSGVILSQLLRGVTDQFCPLNEARAPDMAEALTVASDLAREAVMRPVEGTILTVARAAAEGARSGMEQDGCLLDVLEEARDRAAEALAHTPDLLDVLAKAGVVDAGGRGYVLMFDALLSVIDGRLLPAPSPEQADTPTTALETPFSETQVPEAQSPSARAPSARAPSGYDLNGVMPGEPAADLRYEVMYFLHAPNDAIPAFKDVWAGIGDSIVVVGGDGLWNCHIHTNDIGAAVEAALDCGRPRNIRVSDLLEQVEEERWVREAGSVEPEVYEKGAPCTTGVVAVATGEGIGRIFRSLGVYHHVLGGQTMNPSTAEILAVVEAVEADQVIVLPNNRNIRPVAERLDSLTEKSVRVVPTDSVVEGFAALLAYDPDASADANAQAMESSAHNVVPAEVTRAVRDAPTEAGPVREGQWMGLCHGGVVSIGDSPAEAACALLGTQLGGGQELVTLIEGEGSTQALTRRITEWMHDEYPDVAVEVHHGGQPLYPYLLGIE